MFSASIYGRLGGDPVERTTKNGNPMVTASLAVNVARFDEPEQTEWFGLVAFGKAGEEVVRHQKGDLLSAMGALCRRRFTDKNGQPREGWSMTVEAIVSARSVRPRARRKSQKRDEMLDELVP